jgi:hypothetical protein
MLLRPEDSFVILWSTLGEWFAYRWPVCLVCLFGAGTAMARWRRHPRISLLAVVGLTGLALNTAAFIVIAALVSYYSQSSGMGRSSSDSLSFKVISHLESVIDAGFLALCLSQSSAAAFHQPRRHQAISCLTDELAKANPREAP